MKFIGRLILLIVGIASIAFSIYFIVNAWNALNASGWADIGAYPEKLANLFEIILNAITVLFGISAIFCALRGKMSIKWIIFSLIVIGFAIYYVIAYNINVNFQDPSFVTMVITSFALPIGYILGCILLAFK